MPTQMKEPDFGLVLFCAYTDSAYNRSQARYSGRKIPTVDNITFFTIPIAARLKAGGHLLNIPTRLLDRFLLE